MSDNNQTNQTKQPEEKQETKLNAYTALAEIWGVDAKIIKEAEDKGKVEDLKADFANGNFVLSLADKVEFTKNVQNNYLEDLTNSTNIPKKLYDTIKGNIMQQQERKLKNAYDYEGTDYENVNTLIDNIIREKAKQPNVSKAEDLSLIKDLQKQISNSQDVAQKNLALRDTISSYDEKSTAEKEALILKYENDKRNEIIKTHVDKIPFQDYDDEGVKEMLRGGFITKFKDKIDIRFNENLNAVAYDKATNIRIDDNLDSAMSIPDVFAKIIKDDNITLKIQNQGANITSSQNNGYVFRTREDAQKHIADNNITDHNEQMKIFDQIPRSTK
ncbi:MAG: hypothetical protein GY849_02335 [Deltaproteobacteria bacterium]|nr:hypothetical protein [Deltaproteobacteria bacterium]